MTIRVGVVGAGNIATSRHIPAFRRHEATKVTSIYDTDRDTTAAVADEYDLRPAENLEAIFAHSDLVSICTPPDTHCDIAIDAIEAGCHVLCEKPMAMTVAEADEMIAVADDNDRVLSIVHNFLYKRSIETVDRLIGLGKLGTISRTYMIKPESDEKRAKEYLMRTDLPSDASANEWKLYRLFWDEAAHLMYLTRNVLGDISLETATVSPSPLTDYASVRARYTNDDGAEGNVLMLLDAPISEWWFVVMGDAGIALVDIYRDNVIHFSREPDHSATQVLKVLLSGLVQITSGTVRTGIDLVIDRKRHGYRIPDAGFLDQVTDIVTSIQTGEPLAVPPTEDRKAIEAMEAVVQATPMSKGRNAEGDRKG